LAGVGWGGLELGWASAGAGVTNPAPPPHTHTRAQVFQEVHLELLLEGAESEAQQLRVSSYG